VLNEWLFDHRPELPEVDTANGYDLYHVELDSQQTEALRQITSAQGWDGVVRLLGNAANVHTIGWIIGRNGFLHPTDVDLWELVEAENPKLRQFASVYVAGAFDAEGFAFLENLQLETRLPAQAAAVLRSTPFERPTWEWIDSNTNNVTRDNYWQLCQGSVRSGNDDDLPFVIDRLLQARRPFTAADILQMAMQDSGAGCEMVYRVLEAGLSSDRNQEEVGQLASYAIQQLIQHLQEQSTDQLQRLARIEWGYLPVLDRHSSPVEPATLIRELQATPSLFVDLLKVVYRGANEEPRERPLDELEQIQWQHAFDLLETFSRVPGAGDDGEVDEEHLSQWTAQVRSLAEQEDRIGVADQQLGRLFSRYPRRESTSWPPLAICRVMESSGSVDLLGGFTTGLINGRGVTSRSPTTGGDPERALAADYRAIAEEHQAQFPHLAESLRNLAEYYDRYAEREDEEAERRRLER